MNISINPNTGVYDASAGSGAAVSGAAVSAQTEQTKAVDISQIKVGDTFSGQVMVTGEGGSVQIMLGDKSLLNANVSKNLQLIPGQMMSFQVKSMAASKLVLTPLFANLAGDSAIAKALGDANLAMTSQNVRMVESMMEQGMSVDADSLSYMSNLSSPYPLNDPKSIVLMTKLGFPLTAENVEQFEAYSNNQYKIADGVESLANEFSKIAGESLGLNESILDIFSDNIPADMRSAVSNAMNGDTAALRQLLFKALPDAFQEFANIDSASSTAAESIEDGQEGTSGDAKAVPEKGIAVDNNSQQNAASETIKASESAVSQGEKLSGEKQGGLDVSNKGLAGGTLPNGDLEVEPIENKNIFNPWNIRDKISDSLKDTSIGGFIRKVVQNIKPDSEGGSAASNIFQRAASANMRDINGRVAVRLEDLMGRGQLKELSKLLEDAGAPKSMARAIESGKLETRQALQLTRTLLDEIRSQEIDPKILEGAKNLINSKPYRFMLKNEILDKFLMSPQDVSDKKKVEEYYRRTIQQADRALSALNAAGRDGTPLAKGLENLKSNVSFMNDLNHILTYVQLPLKMNNNSAHGDLYVYTNKKNLAKKDGAVSALLHLDMQHLGTMDVHVSMNAGNTVKTHFIMQRAELLDFIAAHLPELDKSLSKRGYRVSSDVSLNKEDRSVPDIMFNGSSNAKLIQTTSFDVRA